eukprot:388658-Pelagomonas_calceolata.AAC.3
MDVDFHDLPSITALQQMLAARSVCFFPLFMHAHCAVLYYGRLTASVVAAPCPGRLRAPKRLHANQPHYISWQCTLTACVVSGMLPHANDSAITHISPVLHCPRQHGAASCKECGDGSLLPCT